jgi:hypothetical protein
MAMVRDDVIKTTIRYIDGLFGPGMGKRHAAFLDKLESEELREMVHRYHALEEDNSHISIEENYLVGMCVLFATKNHGTASMFAKVLLHLGTPKRKIIDAVTRMSMWIGGLPAAEVAFHVQRAIREYEADGLGSLGAWFPPGEESA